MGITWPSSYGDPPTGMELLTTSHKNEFFTVHEAGQHGEYLNEVRWTNTERSDGMSVANWQGCTDKDTGVVYNCAPNSGTKGTYFKWNGKKWVPIGQEEAMTLFTSQDFWKEQDANSNQSSALDMMKVAVEPLGRSLRYPRDVSTMQNSDFVLFDFFDYQPPFKDAESVTLYDLPKELRGSKSGYNPQETAFVNETLGQYNMTGLSAKYYSADKKVYPQILMYVPDDISDTFACKWEGKAFGSTAAGLLASAGKEGGMNKIKSGLNELNKNFQKLPAEAAAQVVTTLAKSITGDTITQSDVFSSISGVVRNPNVEVLFQNPNLRTFSLKFKLTPYNEREAADIRMICQTFKKAMLPSYNLGDARVMGMGQDGINEGDSEETIVSKNRGLNASFIRVPKVCKVTFMRGHSVNPFLPGYKMCAITDCSVNYTPDGNYATYSDGSPVAVELSISFMETKIVFAEDIGGVPDLPANTANERFQTQE